MINNSIYISRPRKIYSSKEDMYFITHVAKYSNKEGKILFDENKFKNSPISNFITDLENKVSRVDRVFVLHENGIIDQNQFFEVLFALIRNIPIFGVNVNETETKRVESLIYTHIGFDKIAMLNLKENIPI